MRAYEIFVSHGWVERWVAERNVTELGELETYFRELSRRVQETSHG